MSVRWGRDAVIVVAAVLLALAALEGIARLVEPGDLESLQVEIWREWAAKHGVPMLDFFPCFIGREPWREVVDRYFIPGDAHWNELGHRLVAAELLRTIEGSGELCSQAASSS